jgi:hypothetical protein
MTPLLLAVVPIVLTALFAGQVAVTRTGRLRKDILANLDLLGRLSAEHPNRAALEAKNGELVGVLVRRQRRRYGPFTQPGVFFGTLVSLAGVALVMAGGTALIAAGVLPATPSDPATPGDQWAAAAFLLIGAVGLVGFAVWSAHRQLREHPPPVQQPTETAKAGTESA